MVAKKASLPYRQSRPRVSNKGFGSNLLNVNILRLVGNNEYVNDTKIILVSQIFTNILFA